MRIGVTGFGPTTEKLVRQAERAEADGFASLWAPSAVAGDPLVALALAARATSRLEVGTAVLQTYPTHPALMAARAASVADAIGPPGRFTLGIGPSHQPVVEGLLGMAYDHPGRHTEEYVQIVAALLRGAPVSFAGTDLRATAGAPPLPEGVTVPVLVSALGPRLLRVAGQNADGTITWMANATAVATHVAPRITEAAASAGRPAPRIVVGLPVAVHDDVAEARAVAAEQFSVYGTLPNYRRILDHGGAAGPAEAAIVGDEAAVTEQVEALFEAGATDVWAAPFAVGADKAASRSRTRELLKELAAA
jgi:F420-dependent oxidoreductase-like protein